MLGLASLHLRRLRIAVLPAGTVRGGRLQARRLDEPVPLASALFFFLLIKILLYFYPSVLYNNTIYLTDLGLAVDSDSLAIPRQMEVRVPVACYDV